MSRPGNTASWWRKQAEYAEYAALAEWPMIEWSLVERAAACLVIANEKERQP